MAVARHLRPGGAVSQAPANVELEQALLGAILYDNAAYGRIGDGLRAEHFYEPFHQRLFVAIESALRKGRRAEPILLADQFVNDRAFEELGGLLYLADLVDHAPPATSAPDYAQAVHDLALRRQLIQIGGDISVAAARPDDDRPAREQIEIAEQRLYELVESGASSQGFKIAETYLAEAVEMAAKAFSRDGGLAGLSTGLVDVDQKTGGLHPSDLVIIAARPAMGKTSLAVNIAFDVARRYSFMLQPDGSHRTVSGGRVAFFSLEMSAEQLGLRLLAQASGVSSDRLRRGDIDVSEFERVRDAATEIQAMTLLVDATGGITLAKLAARARRMKRGGGLDLIVIDYLQLMASGQKTENRVQEITAISVGLKALAKDLAVPIVALSQLSRQVENREDKRPQLSDLRESGSIEQDADMVMFIYRKSYYLSRLEPRPDTDEHFAWQAQMDACAGKADLIIGKQRHGPTGSVKVEFDEDLTKFSSLTRSIDFACTRKFCGDDA